MEPERIISKPPDLRLEASRWSSGTLTNCRPLSVAERARLSTKLLRGVKTLMRTGTLEEELGVASELFCLDERRAQFLVRAGDSENVRFSDRYVFSASPMTLSPARLMRAIVTAFSRRAFLFRAAHFLEQDMDTGVVDYLINGYPEHQRPVGRALRMASYFETVWDLASIENDHLRLPLPLSAKMVRLIQERFRERTRTRSVALHTPLFRRKREAIYRLREGEHLPTYNGRGTLVDEGDVWDYFYGEEGRHLHERELFEHARTILDEVSPLFIK